MGLVCGASVPIVGLEGVCGCSLMGLACGCCSLLGLAVAHRSLMGGCGGDDGSPPPLIQH